MKITSKAFAEGMTIPKRYTCDGENLSPPLEFLAVPAAVQSLVLIVDDPDVPESVRKDRLWVHWILFNIPAQVGVLREGDPQPPGTAGRGTGGELTYQGPCPPDREHRYFFKLYALDSLLTLPVGATKPEVEKAMQHHILGECALMGRYTRPMSRM